MTWTSVENGLPTDSFLKVVFLEGRKTHSEASWVRSGYALINFHTDEWNPQKLRKAFMELDMDAGHVTLWCNLPEDPP